MKSELASLKKIANLDPDVVTVFVHGSFVTKTTNDYNFRELRVFDKNKFIFSKFELIKIRPDIDVIYVSKDIRKSEKNIKKIDFPVKNFFVTINLIGIDEFNKNVYTHSPVAIKRILLFRKLKIIKGSLFLNNTKKKLTAYFYPLDKQVQDEYDFMKKYLRLLQEYECKNFILFASDYKRLFPFYYEFIMGKLKNGFPDRRIKLVFPKSMNLKAKLDISTATTEELL